MHTSPKAKCGKRLVDRVTFCLKSQSIDIHKLWIEQSRPRSGPTHLERMRVRADYRRAIKAAQLAPKREACDKVHSAIELNDTYQFWSFWRQLYSKDRSPYAPMVDGKSTKSEIADVSKNASKATRYQTANQELMN